MHAVAYEEPVLAERLGPLRPVVEALLRKSPQERPSAAAVRSALQGVVSGRTDVELLPPATVREFRPLAPLAEVDTMTGGRNLLAPPGTAVPTGRHTTSPVLSPPQPSHTAKPRRPWWAPAGTAVLAASVVGGLFLTGTLPLDNEPKATTTSRVVQSAAGWQSVAGVSVQRGDRITVQFVSGEWTANHRTLPMTGPAGYDANADKLPGGTKACKVKGSAPYAALLARLVGDENFPVHTVGRRLTFRAAAHAALQLGINDAAGLCSEDNKGTLTVQVSVTHQR